MEKGEGRRGAIERKAEERMEGRGMEVDWTEEGSVLPLRKRSREKDAKRSLRGQFIRKTNEKVR